MTEVKAIRCPYDLFGTDSVILADAPEFDASDQRSGSTALKQVLRWMRASCVRIFLVPAVSCLT